MIGSGGVGTYLQTLLSALAEIRSPHSFTALLRPQDRHYGNAFPSVRVVEVSGTVYSPVEQWTIPRAAPRGSLLHVPHYNVPFAYRGPLVATIHDTLHLEFPDNFRSRAAAWYARQLLTAGARKARRIITGSEASKRSLVERCAVPDSRIHVIPYRLPPRLLEATPDSRFLPAHGLGPQGYFLYVGQLKMHKNIPGLVEGFAQFAASHPEVKLVAVAYVSDDRFDVVQMAGQRGIDGRVLVLSKLDFPTLKTLYQNALALILPSFGEGFGLPVIEAMALGTPVIASDIPPIREAAGTAALLVNPHKPGEIADAMRDLYASDALRRELIARGTVQARKFADHPLGASTLRVYEEALG